MKWDMGDALWMYPPAFGAWNGCHCRLKQNNTHDDANTRRNTIFKRIICVANWKFIAIILVYLDGNSYVKETRSMNFYYVLLFIYFTAFSHCILSILTRP